MRVENYRETMRRQAQRLLEREPVDRERRVFLQEPRDSILADVQDLGVDERARFGDPIAEQIGLLVELQIGLVARVLGSLFPGIDGQTVVTLGEVGLKVKTLLEARSAVAQMPLAGGERLELCVDLVGVGVPGGDRTVELGGGRIIRKQSSVRDEHRPHEPQDDGDKR